MQTFVGNIISRQVGVTSWCGIGGSLFLGTGDGRLLVI